MRRLLKRYEAWCSMFALPFSLVVLAVVALNIKAVILHPRWLPDLEVCTPAERAYLDAYKAWWSDDGDMILVSELEHDMLDTWREE